MKVFELAIKLGTSDSETIDLLKDLGIKGMAIDSEVDESTCKMMLDLSDEIDSEQKAEGQDSASTAQPAEPKKKPRVKEKKKEVAAIKEESPIQTEKPKTEEEVTQEEKQTQAPEKPTKKDKNKEEEDIETEIRLETIREKSISLRELAERMDLKVSELIKEGLKKGLMLSLNQEIDIAVASELVLPFHILIDHKVEKASEIRAIEEDQSAEQDTEKDLKTRPPVVTIMGHVDHGKTKLLDKIRESNIVGGEAGGITQHIGAYQVEKKKKRITFIDTPGHEAFTTLRARGAQVTDIAIIVVAADDGIMPQTIEAIDHAKAAGVPILVAINKIDKPTSNIDRIKQQLVEHDMVPEDWGGKTIVVPVSAIEGTGIEELLEMIVLVAEVQELKANPNKEASGTVIEAHLSKSRGPVATVLIRNGTLKQGDAFVIGGVSGKVRAMFDDLRKNVKKAPPSFPVEILGISDPPQAGDLLQVVKDEKIAKSIADQRRLKEKQDRFRSPVTLEDFSKEIKENKVQKDLNVILKADVRGSLEALINSLQKIKVKDIGVQVLHQATGTVNESDVMLAIASKAIILAFGVDVNSEAERLAETEKISIRKYSIIYKLIDDIHDALDGMLEPEYEKIEIGKIEVRDTFKSSKLGTIAGCFILEGKAIRNSIIDVMRKDSFIHSGKLDSLKRFKEDVKEVQKGFECGVVVSGFNDFKESDIIVVSEMREKKRAPRKKS
ncbi:translation initiation factor IF-2 [Candidatus Margulisiibacteriota bacterium]